MMSLQLLYIDAHFAAGREWEQRLFNSLKTPGITIGMIVYDTTLGTTVADLGISDVTFSNPGWRGDTLRARSRGVSKRDTESRPDTGIVDFEHKVLNQNGMVVASCRRTGLMRKHAA